MYTAQIYEETIPFSLWKWIMGIMGAVTIAFLVLLIYQYTAGGIGSNPLPTWYYLIMFLLFAALTAFMTNFRKLYISITDQSIYLRFGKFKSIIPWNNIQSCTLDNSGILSYGGYGLRISRARGTWIRAYKLTGCPRIILKLKSGKSRIVVFSTKNPQRILEIANQKTEYSQITESL